MSTPRVHPRHRALREAIKASGWPLIVRGSGVPVPEPQWPIIAQGGFIAMAIDPASEVEHDTPDWAKSYGWWRGDTYRKLRQLVFAMDGDRFTVVMARECSAPWAAVTERPLSLKAAIEFLGGDT
jgi:hypothetical protein